jgi:dihydropteroate synthase
VQRLFKEFSLNVHGKLQEFTKPQVMGIVNVTPDSFYAGSRTQNETAIANRVESMLAQDVDMIDIGAYSSRPGAADVTEDEELARLRTGLKAVRSIAPDIIVSVDTFRSEVARMAIDEGADIINDISGGDLDNRMFATVAELKVPYVLMHMRGTPDTMQQLTDYEGGNVTAGVLQELSEKVARLAYAGVCDIIIDPGFGFSKTMEQNYDLLRNMGVFQVFGRPVLAGVSRKSMITRALGIEADEALNGTTVINTLALLEGAAILRVHDVAAARQAVDLTELTIGPAPLYSTIS